MNDKGYAVVTGASSGIGLAFSRELARRGYPLLIISNTEDELAAVAGEIKLEYGVNVISLCVDLAKSDSAKKIFDYCEGNGITTEILVNNAGIFIFRDMIDTKPELIESAVNLHVLTPSMLARLFADWMIREKRKGYILNMSSIAAWMMLPGIALYGATKSYLRCFSRAMRHEVISRGVSITTVCPGAVATGLYGLAPRYLKLGVRLGIILRPERLARKALKKMFQKRAEYIPGGILNRLLVLLVKAMPAVLVRHIKKKLDARITER